MNQNIRFWYEHEFSPDDPKTLLAEALAFITTSQALTDNDFTNVEDGEETWKAFESTASTIEAMFSDD